MVRLYEELIAKKEKVAIIGLGYVGMPLAVAFSKKVNTIGFDISKEKIEIYKSGIDPTKEVGDEEIRKCSVEFSADENVLKDAKLHIVAVPTPIAADNKPDLAPVIGASKMIGRNLQKGSLIVYESTVYPGVTEDICIPLLEEYSGLKCGVDFKVGYSPERINPGDKVYTLSNIVKVVSGMDEESLEEIAKIYELVIDAGVYKASSIKVAEASKVVENAQRDVNIAFMNEITMLFDKMDINTHEVVKAMNTKWNALGFYPGLVGGHCIGVDPYYLIYKAGELGCHSALMESARRANEKMSSFVGEAIIKQLVLANKNVKNSKVAILGITFKENCPDIRNSKVMDIIDYLQTYGINPVVVDIEASAQEVKEEFGIELVSLDDLNGLDCVVFAVAHNGFKEVCMSKLDSMFGDYPNNEKVIIDVRDMLNKEEIEKLDYRYWRV